VFMTFLLAPSRVAGFFGVLAIIVLSLVPGIDRPHTALPGVIAYYSTAFAFALGFRSKASRVGIALGLAQLAGSMEILQLWVPGRHSAILDAVVSSAVGVLPRRKPDDVVRLFSGRALAGGDGLMPIRPEYKWFYPVDWPQLSAMIRFERAKGRCEECGRPHGREQHLGDVRWWDEEGQTWRNGRGRALPRLPRG
jgi:hypothetical protein